MDPYSDGIYDTEEQMHLGGVWPCYGCELCNPDDEEEAEDWRDKGDEEC